MPVLLAEVAAGLPMAASFAFAGGIASVREVRRRAELNSALHELRRPLQVLALTDPEVGEPFESSLRLATAALSRLDGAINGEAPPTNKEPVALRPLAEAAVRRWELAATYAGASLEFDWRGPEASIDGDPTLLSQALDNLIINGVEHGGRSVRLEGTWKGTVVRLVVRDSGEYGDRRLRPLAMIEKLTGHARHGHGLRVVRRTAVACGGSFRLRRTGEGTEASLELPAGGRE